MGTTVTPRPSPLGEQNSPNFFAREAQSGAGLSSSGDQKPLRGRRSFKLNGRNIPGPSAWGGQFSYFPRATSLPARTPGKIPFPLPARAPKCLVAPSPVTIPVKKGVFCVAGMLARSILVPTRRFFFSMPALAAAPIVTHKEYSEKRVVGYTAEQMYDVVASVSEYPQFVPWCRSAIVQVHSANLMVADLQVGFPPVSETYTSRVTMLRPTVVRSVSANSRIFKQLDSVWRFGEGSPGNTHSCTLHYTLIFEFKSSLYSHLSHLFFDQVVRSMVAAFLKRAELKYGPPSLNNFDNVVVIKKVA